MTIGTRFNLLPHREMHRQRARQILLRQALMVAVLSIGCVAVGRIFLEQQITRQAEFNSAITTATESLAPAYRQAVQLQQRYDSLLQRQQLIELLDARRTTSVLLLADVAEALPKDVYLLRFEEDGQQLFLEGRAITSAAIANFIERLTQSQFLRHVVLNEIKTQGLTPPAIYQFSIHGDVLLVGDRQLEQPAGVVP